MQESRLYTGIPKWRERLGIEPNRLITIFEFREKSDHFGSIIHSILSNIHKQKTPLMGVSYLDSFFFQISVFVFLIISFY